MDDFIFGTLATDELRRNKVNSQRSGVSHSNHRTPRDPRPNQPIVLHMTSGPSHSYERAWVYWSIDGEDPSGRSGKASHGFSLPMQLDFEEWDTVLWGYIRHFSVILPGQSPWTVLRYRLSMETKETTEVFADGGAFFGVYIDDDPLPEWTRSAVIYQIFVDRFFPGTGKHWLHPDDPSGFYGGTIAGITEKLEYIADLGFNTLWLSPIFPSPSHHGYDCTDLFEIEPRLGTKADLQELLEKAHHLGLRILLDFVPNHVSELHPAFQDAIHNSHSPYRDWFSFVKWPIEYETFFGVKSLPQLNLRNPGARAHVLDAARYWLDFGADGFRLDYAIGPSQDFWADFRKVTRSVKPDCWTFGEVVDPPDEQISFEGLLDGCLDFILLEALRQTFAFSRWNVRKFANFLDLHEQFFPGTFSRPSFLDNHDMNRILWTCGGDKRKVKLAALCQFTLAGPPITYYGTEAGLSQMRDIRQGNRGLPEESRLPMLWASEQDANLLEYYWHLISARTGSLALQRGERKTLFADQDLLVYSRKFENEERIICLNLGNQPRQYSSGQGIYRMDISTIANCEINSEDGKTTISLPPESGILLRKEVE
jgi:cyclomaltodextrinase / maltogenic alpha-amylase / neopullulanase